MADLTININESITLNNQVIESSDTRTISGIGEISKRILTITTNEAEIATFSGAVASSGHYNDSAVRYIRFTNLDSTNHIALVLKNENNDEFGVKVDKGCSFLYGVDLSGGVVDTMDSADAAGITPDSFGDLVDITCAANTAACDVEVFVASA